jgi:hypothetical protein
LSAAPIGDPIAVRSSSSCKKISPVSSATV